MTCKYDSNGIRTTSRFGTSESFRRNWAEACLQEFNSRSVFHTATNDYEGKRQGNRVVSLGEKPFYNPASKSRREALAGL
jgi:hypothetical protein